MSHIDFVHSLLDEKDWNVEDLTKFLKRDSTTINERSSSGDPPLVRVLKSGKKYTLDAVKLLLDHGASVNCTLSNRRSPLIVAVRFHCCDAVIKELLQTGADVDARDKYGQSCICNAVQVSAPKSVFKLLLDAGCSPNACRIHVSVLHCAAVCSVSALKADVLGMFLEAGADVHRFGSSGQSPLCFALQSGIDARGIQLLLKKGTSVNACTRHASTLLCATDHGWGARLEEDVVRTLLKAGGSTGNVIQNGWAPLQRALRYCKYEKGAIKPLLHLLDVDINDSVVGWKGDSLLHLAVDNSNCKLAVLQLLLSRGAKVSKRNSCGDTPLHLAVRNDPCRHRVVNFLLEKGSPVDAKNKYGKTPLRIAIERGRNSAILRLLLAAGARIWVVKGYMDASLLKLAIDLYERNRTNEIPDRLKTIVKYSLIENSDIALEYLSQKWINAKPLMEFVEKCTFEMQKMDLKDIGHGRTLKEFLGRHSKQTNKSNNYDFYRLLNIVSDNDFPIFFNEISAKVGMRQLQAALFELRLYAVKHSFGFSCVEQKIFFNFECLCEVSKFLTLADMLRLVLAFYVPFDCQMDEYRIEDKRDRGLHLSVGRAACIASFWLGFAIATVMNIKVL